MKRLVPALALALVLLLPSQATAATNVWFFYGAGPHFWSSGIDEMARKAQSLRGVGRVSTHDHMETQRVYDEILASPTSDRAVVVGYSCGGNASLAVAQGLARNGRPVAVLAVQPSVWCGRYLPTTSNVRYAQDTYGNCVQTLGLGCLQFYGDAYKTVNIYRPDLHLEADTDPNSQRDVLGAIYAIANPNRVGPLLRHLHRTTYITRYNGQNVWRLRER
jgi:hypothetical protein